MVTVILLDAPIAVGKTSLIKELAKLNYTCIGEEFSSSKKTAFERQSYYEEMKWLMNCFEKVEQTCIFHLEGKQYLKNKQVIFVDRSPYCASIFADTTVERKTEMVSIVNNLVDDFKKKGINMITICIKENKEIVWKRVLERIKGETWREGLKETDRTIFDKRWDMFYDNKFGIKWDDMISVKNANDLLLKIKKYCS